MKALKVFESLDFERGKNPIDVMDIGIKSWLQNFDTNFFKISSTEERNIMKEKFNDIMSTIKFEEIPVDTKYFPLEMIFGFKDEKNYQQYKLDYDLYLTIGKGHNVSGHITDLKGRPIASNSDTSAGKKGVETILDRVRKTKHIKFPKSRK
jgi:hypothetical protein